MVARAGSRALAKREGGGDLDDVLLLLILLVHQHGFRDSCLGIFRRSCRRLSRSQDWGEGAPATRISWGQSYSIFVAAPHARII